MNHKMICRPVAAILAIVMVLMLASTIPTRATAEGTTYILDATSDLTTFGAGEKADGDNEDVGTDGYFTVFYSAKTKVDGSSKTFDDGYAATQRINFGGTSGFDPLKNVVRFSTKNAATIKIWWVSGGDGRTMAICDMAGTVLSADGADSVKNALYISELSVDAAGTYYLAVPDGSNYLFKVEVTEEAHAEPVVTEYTLDATADLTSFSAGEKADGDNEDVGTNGYFTIFYSAKTKVDGSSKTFDDGYTASQRINFGGKSSLDGPIKNVVKFTTSAPASVKLWWVSGGDGREMSIWDDYGNSVVSTVAAESVKNTLYISELALETAGTYYLAVPTGSNYLFKVSVTETIGGADEKPDRAAWDTVAAPVISEVSQSKDDVIVAVDVEIGYDGADQVVVTMRDADGNELTSKRSIAENTQHTLIFTPDASGEYFFQATASREDEEDKLSDTASIAYILPLKSPELTYAVNAGSGSVTLAWSAVQEATGYEVYVNGTAVGTTVGTEYTVADLTVGNRYSFQAAALRSDEHSALSSALELVVTNDPQRIWGFTRYGSSTNSTNNGYSGSINENGCVTVYSEGGKGKIVPNSTDGVAFYYTPIPTSLNFTLSAKIHVDSWTLSNGQEGFGLMAADRLGPNGDSTSFWNNQYMALGSKVEYYSESGSKYSMKLGLGVLAKTGLTPENLPTGAEMPEGFSTVTTTLDHTPDEQGLGAGTYNIVGNATAAAPGTIAEQTDFILEIQKNNTGYFVTYYDTDGNVIEQIKDYDPNALSKLDSEYVYVGFFAARNARITASDIKLTTIAPEDDLPAEEKPVTYVEPTVTIHSASVTTDESYTLTMISNVAGEALMYLDNAEIGSVTLAGGIRYDHELSFGVSGTHQIQVIFTPDPDQDLGEDTKLSSTAPVIVDQYVAWNTEYAALEQIFVSPIGTSNGAGTKESPVDIYTAVENVHAGQTIVLMPGEYKLSRTLTIQRGIDGTADAPIILRSESSRVILDFQGVCAGIVHAGNYWNIQNIDVTNSANGQKGLQISGNHNVLYGIHTYHNGNTGIQISRYSSADTNIDYWPSYNLVRSCISYGNADVGYEDADGFAAKLTCGVGNVFENCVAYNNADDGWDLYAKVETGPIGSVVIRNCVAYGNGYLEDGTNAGNGNGFKMGGESITGQHQLINSYAFFNKAKGIDSNSCPDIRVFNSVAYNNESYNVAFYTNNSGNTDFQAIGVISFKDESVSSGLTIGDNLKPKGTQDTSKYLGESNFYWDGTASKNAAGIEFTADRFLSLVFDGVSWKADGSIDLRGFLELKEDHVHTAPEFIWEDDFSCIAAIDCYCGFTHQEYSTVTSETTAPTYSCDGWIVYTAVFGDYVDTMTVLIPRLGSPFADVQPAVFYFDAVMWALDNGITKGTSSDTFSPDDTCLRAHVITFLWREAGSPEPINIQNPFEDVDESAFYYKAVLWAVEQGITFGVDSTHFAPLSTCSRAQAVTFLHRSLGGPAPVTGEHPFVDIEAGSFYERSAQWAYDAGIIIGMDPTHFAPESECSRAQIITILYRAFADT